MISITYKQKDKEAYAFPPFMNQHQGQGLKATKDTTSTILESASRIKFKVEGKMQFKI
jgi:hypothetical protein